MQSTPSILYGGGILYSGNILHAGMLYSRKKSTPKYVSSAEARLFLFLPLILFVFWRTETAAADHRPIMDIR